MGRLIRSPFAALALGVLYFALFVPDDSPRAVDEFDRDEGFNLMKAFLVRRGFSLYGEIWSDQPPGYTYLLAAFTRVFGETPEAARLLTTLFASAAIAAVYEICRRNDASYRGHLAGFCAALTLVMSRAFVQYSAAVMITLPSVACILFACLPLSSGAQRGRARLATAGILLGLGLGIKLMILPVLPAFLLLFGPEEISIRGRAVRIPARQSLIFGAACFLALALVFVPSLGHSGLTALYEAHASGAAVMRYSSVWNFFREDALLFVLAAIGAALGARRNACARFAVAWIALATVALARHAPVWHHHRFLITVPASLLVGIGVAEMMALARGAFPSRLRVARWAALLLVLGMIGWWSTQGGLSPLTSVLRHHERSRTGLALERSVRRHAPGAKLAVTTNQTIAYRLGLAVPPNLAVTSSKRRNSGHLKDDEIRRTIKETQPDVLILTNRWGKAFTGGFLRKRIGAEYRRVYYKRSARELAVYVRRPARIAPKRRANPHAPNERAIVVDGTDL